MEKKKGRYFYNIINVVIVGLVLAVYLITSNKQVHAIISNLAGVPTYKGEDNAAFAVVLNRGSDIEYILGEFKDAGIRATFFVRRDSGIEKEQLGQIIAEGHEIAITGPAMSKAGVEEAISACEAVFGAYGVEWSRLYMPDEEYTSAGASAVREMGYKLSLWSLDDTVQATAENTDAESAIYDVYEGAIIRINGTSVNSEILKKITENAKIEEIKFVTISEMIDR